MANASPLRLACLYAHSPFAPGHGQESLDLPLAATAFEYQVSLVFLQSGLLHLIAVPTQAKSALLSQHTALLPGLHYYDIEQVYYAQQDADHLGLSPQLQKLDYVRPLTDSQIRQLLARQDWVLHL